MSDPLDLKAIERRARGEDMPSQCDDCQMLLTEIRALNGALAPFAAMALELPDLAEFIKHAACHCGYHNEAPPDGIYVASKTYHAAIWRNFRAQGQPIISTWIDEAGPGESRDRADLWRRCIAEASRCWALILFAEDGETLKGALLETGAALAHGRPVILFGNAPRWTFEDHPLVTRVATAQEAFQLAGLRGGEAPHEP
jgi:hypothetical protein